MSATAAYVGSQGRNLFLRSVANNIVQVLTNPNPANAALVVREFSIPVRDDVGNITSVQNPYAEVDYKTSGGQDHYNAMQLSLSKRASNGLATNVQYTYGFSRGNTAGSNEAQTAANNARALSEFDYDIGYNSFDVRHTFNLSALYEIPYKGSGLSGAVLGNWQVGAILNARSGLPVPVQIVRPDVVYRDAAGNIFASAATDRIAIINTPRGGSTRNVRRPDLIPGVDPFIHGASASGCVKTQLPFSVSLRRFHSELETGNWTLFINRKLTDASQDGNSMLVRFLRSVSNHQ